MSEQKKPVINIRDVPVKDVGNGKDFRAKAASFSRSIRLTGLGAMYYEVEPGNKAFPFHAHHVLHEMFVILEGEGTYRFGSERFPVKAGDVCAAPSGRGEVAHQIINTGKPVLKYLGISTMADTEVVEYPDSKKFAVTSKFDWSNPKNGGGIRYVGRVENSLDYFEGEK